MQTKETATKIQSEYRNNDITALISSISKISDGDDLYMRIDKGNQTIFPDDATLDYQKEISDIKEVLDAQDNVKTAISKTSTNAYTQNKSYIDASYLDPGKQLIMYVISPLDPVSSTITILQNQLIYIMVIALALAFALSYYLSTVISKPITSVTRSAQKLADGQYGITFQSKGQYSEINNLAKTLNKTSCELEKSVMLQKDLMANVSHDLRTPLTMIKSYAEMIRDLSGNNPKKREGHLQVIIEEADRLNTLVSDMLALSAMQSGTLELSSKSFNIKAAVASILMPYRILEEQENFTIEFNCKYDIFVDGDEDKIKQVISNLLTNAIKYCGADKKVFINIRKWGHRVHCEVVDHGVGIKPEELSHIWERYYKTSSNHARSTSGSGLGLSIVKEILSLHKAKFGAESKVGKGTTMWFELIASKPSQNNDKYERKHLNRHLRLRL